MIEDSHIDFEINIEDIMESEKARLLRTIEWKNSKLGLTYLLLADYVLNKGNIIISTKKFTDTYKISITNIHRSFQSLKPFGIWKEWNQRQGEDYLYTADPELIKKNLWRVNAHLKEKAAYERSPKSF